MAKDINGWFVAATLAAFLGSLAVYVLASSTFPVEQASLEEAHVPLPAGPRKYP